VLCLFVRAWAVLRNGNHTLNPQALLEATKRLKYFKNLWKSHYKRITA